MTDTLLTMTWVHYGALALLRAGLLHLLIFNLCAVVGTEKAETVADAKRVNKRYNLAATFGPLFALAMGWLS